MAQNEAVQLTVVAVIVLAALVWVAVKASKMSHGKSGGCNCGSCDTSADCKAKELKEEIVRRRRRDGNCHDGQSARN